MTKKITPSYCGKKHYPSKGAAVEGLRALKRRPHPVSGADLIHPYWCAGCDAWHIGHRRGSRRIEKEKAGVS